MVREPLEERLALHATKVGLTGNQVNRWHDHQVVLARRPGSRGRCHRPLRARRPPRLALALARSDSDRHRGRWLDPGEIGLKMGKRNVGRRHEEVNGRNTKLILAAEASSPDFRTQLAAALR